MKKFITRLGVLFLLPLLCYAQKPLSEAEEKDLSHALSEAGNSAVDFIRALEHHLAKYPDSPQKNELELAIAKAAVEAKDNARVLQYGERVLARDMDNAQLLDRVSRVLLNSDDRSSSERALKYSKRLEEILVRLETQGVGPGHNQAQMSDDLNHSISRALVFESRATGNLGKIDEAVALAKKAFDRYPSAESAREVGKWLAKGGHPSDAIQYYADAFTISDPGVTEMERAKDRAKLSELYASEHNGETGLGDIVLAAYDRMAELQANRVAMQQLKDPNANRTNVMDFTLSGVNGDKLPLASLRGKVIVMDFWATWCGPCRAQYPLYEKVKQRFASNQDVIFLGINTDEDHSVVKPFLEQVKWSKSVYFEDGLGTLLRVSSIPATIVIDKQGKIISRMNGFLPERFVDMLSERINEALGSSPNPQTSAALKR